MPNHTCPSSTKKGVRVFVYIKRVVATATAQSILRIGLLAAALAWVYSLGLVRGVMVVLLVSFVASHEFSHYLRMRHHGVPVEEIGIGIPRGPFRKLQWQFVADGLRVRLSPLAIVAYVDEGESGKAALQALPYRARADIFGAGVGANLLQVSFLAALLPIHDSNPSWDRVLWTVCSVLVVFLVTVKLYGDFPGIIAGYVFPLLGFALLGYLAWLLVPPLITDFAYASGNHGALPGQMPVVLGPVTVVQLIGNTSTVLEAHVILVLLLSGLVTANLLPIKSLDGGQTAEALLDSWLGSKWAQAVIWAITGTVGASLAVIMIRSEFGDILLATAVIIALAYAYDRRVKTRPADKSDSLRR